MELFMGKNPDCISLFSRSDYQERENKQPWEPQNVELYKQANYHECKQYPPSL